jgi:hypothetical protein
MKNGKCSVLLKGVLKSLPGAQCWLRGAREGQVKAEE